MTMPKKQDLSFSDGVSPLRLSLLAINAVCLGACMVLLTIRSANGPLVLLTIGVGLSFGTGFVGAMAASRKRRMNHPIVRDYPAGDDEGTVVSRRT